MIMKLSEKDEATVRIAIEILEHENYLILAERLKSLSLLHHWKPRRDQLVALESACKGHILNLDHLESLYNDLNKLCKED